MSSSVISSGIKAIKSARRLAATKAPVTLTPSATTRLKELMAKQPEMAGIL